MHSLSAIIITQNEQANLHDCLASLQGLVQEIVVVDGNSSDLTRDIAAQFGAKVVNVPHWPGFGPQKNHALSLATQSWVLSIDADERVSPDLALEIQQLLSTEPPFKAYDISRLSWYCGRFIQHAGWRPDYVLRLFERHSARFSDDLVHERVLPKGAVGKLQAPLIHYSYTTYEQVIQKMDKYSTASAEQLFARGKTSSMGQAMGHGIWTFLRTYLFKAGFLDGAQGLALAISNAEGSYYKHLKLALLCQNAKATSTTKSSTPSHGHS